MGNIANQISKLACEGASYSIAKVQSKYYGVKDCSKNIDPKFLKIKKDILSFYKELTPEELQLFKTSKRIMKNKLFAEGDELYYWLLNNFSECKNTSEAIRLLNEKVTLLSTMIGKEDPKIMYQTTPVSTWVFAHDFDHIPVINVYDSNNVEMIGYVRQDLINSKTITLHFSSPVSGKIVLV